MQTVATVGLDIAKSVFRQLKRRYVLAFFQKLSACLIGIEACASSHYWSPDTQGVSTSTSVQRDVGRPDDLCPFLGFGRD